MVAQLDLGLADGRRLRVHDTGPGEDRLTLLWQHGSPQTGALLDPLLLAAAPRRIRMISYGRPSYGGSSPQLGRDVASAAADVAAIVSALGVDRFAVMGASGGGPHALACAAGLGERVLGAVTLAGIAPRTDAFDYYAGMQSDAGLRAAVFGRDERARLAETEEFDEDSFTAADYAMLAGTWRALGADAGAAAEASPDGLIDDDVASVNHWGFALADVTAPVLVVQGGQDRVVPPAHARYLVDELPHAQLWLRPADGHVSVLAAVPVAMDWLLDLAATTSG